MGSLTTSDRNGGCLFAADPQKTFDGQTIFWAPEALSTVLPVRGVVFSVFSGRHHLDLAKIAGGQFRRAPDGWHAVVPLGGAIHRLWLHELPADDSLLAVELPLDANFDVRSRAAHRFWLALEKRPLGSPPLPLPGPAASAAHTGRSRARWMVGGKQLSRNSRGPVRETSRPRSRLEISRSAQPHHPSGPNGPGPDAWWLPRIAAADGTERSRLSVLCLGVSKIDPLIFGIPLRGLASPL